MGDPLRARTELLLADYLQFCARRRGAPGLQPRTPEAALLRSIAEDLRRRHAGYFAPYRDYAGNRAELLATLADMLLPDDLAPTWHRVVALVALAGTLLEHPGRGRPEEAARECRRLVAQLCARLVGRHRAWLEAQGGWDGFCLCFSHPLPLSYWRTRLVQTFLSCVLATALIYLWKRLCRSL